MFRFRGTVMRGLAGTVFTSQPQCSAALTCETTPVRPHSRASRVGRDPAEAVQNVDRIHRDR
jgi:hypothetical protein